MVNEMEQNEIDDIPDESPPVPNTNTRLSYENLAAIINY